MTDDGAGNFEVFATILQLIAVYRENSHAKRRQLVMDRVSEIRPLFYQSFSLFLMIFQSFIPLAHST